MDKVVQKPKEWSLLAALACHCIPICGADYRIRLLMAESREELNAELAKECIDLAEALVNECKRREDIV